MSRTRQTIVAFLGAMLVSGLPVGAASEEPGPSAWVGGDVETPDFSLTIPSDWIAAGTRRDASDVAGSIVQRLEDSPDGCDRRCEDAVPQWVSQLDEGTLGLLGPIERVSEGLLREASQCQVVGPQPLPGRTLEEIADIVFDVFADSDRVEASVAPHGSRIGDAEVWSFDFSAPADDHGGVVYLYGHGERMARLTCRGPLRAADDWVSLAESFRLKPLAGEEGGASEPIGAATSGLLASDLELMLPLWVGGQSLATHSHQGLEYLRDWSGLPEEHVRTLESDPGALEQLIGYDIELDDIQFAMAGRANTSDPARFITATRIRGLPARMLPLSLSVQDPEAGVWTEQAFGTRIVQVGTEAMLDPSMCCGGRPYVYDVDQVRFTVLTDDEEWAAEAIARLRPDPVAEDAGALVDLPDGWQPGYSPTVDEAMVARSHDDGIRLAAHDGTRYGQRYIPTLEAYYSQTRLDMEVPETLDRWAAAYPVDRAHGRNVTSIARITLPSGEALRVEMESTPPGAGFDVAEVRYLIAAPAGVFDLLFSVEADQLADYEATFHDMAGSLLRGESDADGLMARLARGEATRTDVELMLGGYRSPELASVAEPGAGTGSVVHGGRLAVPAEGFALEVPEGWHAVDLTHPHATAEMRDFDATTRMLLEGRLLPENPLLRGNFPYAPEAGHLAALAIEESLGPEPPGAFSVVALAPHDGVGAQHECVVHGWATNAESAEAEASLTLSDIREDDPSASLRTIGLPAGEAAMISASFDSWELTIYTLLRGGVAFNLECGNDERHDELWRDVAESFTFMDG